MKSRVSHTAVGESCVHYMFSGLVGRMGRTRLPSACHVGRR